jgi:hypothetical protein
MTRGQGLQALMVFFNTVRSRVCAKALPRGDRTRRRTCSHDMEIHGPDR